MNKHANKVSHTKSVEYEHPTKRHAGSGTYSPINKRNKTAARLRKANAVKYLEDQLARIRMERDNATASTDT